MRAGGYHNPRERSPLGYEQVSCSCTIECNRQVCTFGDGGIKVFCSDGIYFVNEGRDISWVQRNERGRETFMVSKDEPYPLGKKNIIDE